MAMPGAGCCHSQAEHRAVAMGSSQAMKGSKGVLSCQPAVPGQGCAGAEEILGLAMGHKAGAGALGRSSMALGAGLG